MRAVPPAKVRQGCPRGFVQAQITPSRFKLSMSSADRDHEVNSLRLRVCCAKREGQEMGVQEKPKASFDSSVHQLIVSTSPTAYV